MIRRASLLFALTVSTGAAALDLPASARLTAERVTDTDRYYAPIGPFDGDAIPVQPIDGRIVRRAWQLPGGTFTALQVLSPLRAQLEAAGYTQVLDCADDRCGGFDFRFGVEVLPAPAMFVDLQNFHAMTLRKGPADSPEAIVSLLVSAGPNAVHVQIIEATASPDDGVLPVATPESRAPESPAPGNPAPPAAGLAEDLLNTGFLVLDGLDFGTGATGLGPGPFPVLAELAGFLAANPDLRLALVGHTDTVGGLDGNVAISRARAQSVRQRLIGAYDIDPSRLDAEGMGYLAPRASNVTRTGREANRRVEAVVLPAE